jgi:hypothetical protein
MMAKTKKAAAATVPVTKTQKAAARTAPVTKTTKLSARTAPVTKTKKPAVRTAPVTKGKKGETAPAAPTAVSARDAAIGAIRDTYQKNFMALAEATQALTEGATAVFRRQQELLQRAIPTTVSRTNERGHTVV